MPSPWPVPPTFPSSRVNHSYQGKSGGGVAALLYSYGVDHSTGREPPASHREVDERLAVVLDGLRSIADHDDPHWQPPPADARAIVDDAWSAIADALCDQPAAGAVLAALRTLARTDVSLLHACDASHRIAGVLSRLEAAPCTVTDLMDLAPRLVTELGFDRAIFSRIVNGVWISQSVCVPDDPEWAREINRIGQEQPQPLVPGLFETEIARRREAMNVTDVQHEARVHRPIADASRSTSYAAAPVIAGNRVVGLLHADRYRQGRDTDVADCEILTSYARGLELAFSRARAVQRLESIGSALHGVASECGETADTVHHFDLDAAAGGGGAHRALPAASCLPVRASRSVREALTAREIEILEQMALGRTNPAIATRLFISEGTVKQHVKHILRKLGAENRVEAVSLLYQSDER